MPPPIPCSCPHCPQQGPLPAPLGSACCATAGIWCNGGPHASSLYVRLWLRVWGSAFGCCVGSGLRQEAESRGGRRSPFWAGDQELQGTGPSPGAPSLPSHPGTPPRDCSYTTAALGRDRDPILQMRKWRHREAQVTCPKART